MTKRKKHLFKTRTSKKIGPGTRLTVTKKGIGISTKIPGTKHSYSTRTGLTKRRRPKKKTGCSAAILLIMLALFLLT